MSVAELIKSSVPMATVKDEPSIAGVNGAGKGGGPSTQTLEEFYKEVQMFHERRGTPIVHFPKISGREVNLQLLYGEVTERGGFMKVNLRDEWDEVVPAIGLREKCVNVTAALKHIYRRYLEKYERLTFFGEDPDKMEAQEASDVGDIGGRSRNRYSILGSAIAINTVPMSYNYRQHIVAPDRRSQLKMSTDLHKPSAFEKLMLSLISPLPNEQDFAINACTLMVNETKHTLKLNEYPKLLDVLLAHTGVYADFSLRQLFNEVYVHGRRHSLYGFWRDLLYDKPQILELYAEEATQRGGNLMEEADLNLKNQTEYLGECAAMDFFNLGREQGVQEFVGQRVQQIAAILRNLSFFEENLPVFGKSRTFLRFVVMCANIRWGNIHIQALDIAGNIALEVELQDPVTDDLTRNLLATLCEGMEGADRAVVINSLEILTKVCQRESNEEHIVKCLNMKFYQTLCQYLTLNDIMLLIFSLEAIYALTSMGARACHSVMQVRGIVDSLMSLITVEAQSYGPDGCILMRVVETVPGNMLPMVAQNIANLQNAAVIQKQQHTPLPTPTLPQPLQQTQLVLQNDAQQPSDGKPTAVPTQLPKATSSQSQTPAQPAQSFTHEDEQYALAWLGATFERAASVDSKVESQELYRMYLSHCQKSGKHSVVNHVAFPRLVRLIFNNSVGPVHVKRADGSETQSFHYVSIRLRAQPLPIQGKGGTPAKGTEAKPTKTEFNSLRKLKKKKPPLEQYTISPQAQQELPQQLLLPDVPDTNPKSENVLPTVEVQTQALVQEAESCNGNGKPNTNVLAQLPTQVEEENNLADMKFVPQDATENAGKCSQIQQQQLIPSTETMGTQSPQMQPQQSLQQQPSSSLIKSLLANKVNQRQQKQKELTSSTAVQTTTQTNVIAGTAQPQAQPIKVTSNAISALVNNPLMQNTSVKVGQTTIKPLSLQSTFEKKQQQQIQQQQVKESVPPPLAPLSGGNVPKDACGRSVIISNQMLVDILDKKTGEPPIPATIIKRKLDEPSNVGTESAKRLSLDHALCVEPPVTPSKNAANLYAEMAASILEDEDLDDIPPLPPQTLVQSSIEQPQQSLIIQKQNPMQNVQRQLVFQTNQPQLKLTQSGGQQIPTAMATIKTDQGLQTVPVILQQKSLEQSQPQLIQQVLQQAAGGAHQAQQTQYMLATNPQGQTYLVAQQPQPPPPPQPPTQTVLVTQTPQQQSTGQKTIIILQQQMPSAQPQQMSTQKMFMTTPQGQQVLVAQRQQPNQTPQYFINPQTGTATHIQHVPVSTMASGVIQQTGGHYVQRQIMQSPGLVSATQQQHQQQHLQQTQTGQISPSLLSQLNHIPATIKLHQPVPQTPVSPMHHQAATISRLGKSVSIVQTAPPAPPLQIPQLQQHQSIIQQHIISGPAEKRQVIVGGRTIEIKETVITQAPPPPQQSQLNSQTIITKQTPTLTQAQQQLRTVIEQQAQQHPSIIQQKISLQTPTKLNEMPSLPQVVLPPKAVIQTAKKPISQVRPQLPTPQLPTPQLPIPQLPVPQVPIPQLPSLTPGLKAAGSMNVGPPPLTHSITPPAVQPQPLESVNETKLDDGMNTAPASVPVLPILNIPATPPASRPQTPPPAPSPVIAQPTLPLPPVDPNWLYICDWRNCPRKKYKSIADLQHHACAVHCPDHLDPAAEIFCQWGVGPSLCDGIPRKRYSLMTHLIDRHLTQEGLRSAMQRRIATGTSNLQPTQPPVTIVRNLEQSQRSSTASPALSTSSSSSLPSTGSSAIHAIKRHTVDFVNAKELMDENEGPVTKSIRLTASLILRNLATYTTTAKRCLRRYEPNLANVALSNVESSMTISHILYELNN